MKVLLLGAGGQLGMELTRTCPVHVSLATCDYPKVDFLLPDSIRSCIDTSAPDMIINAAAYTAVDRAEKETKTAFRINRDAVSEIAVLAAESGIGLVHISTDYVFSGRHYTPWLPQDKPDPQSIYGRSKLGGETAVRDRLQGKALIIRTAWLYSAHGQNFVKTMLKLMSDGKSISVIDDQVGTPTWANGLARAVWTCLDKGVLGVHHWTDAGTASWYDFAVAIQEEGLALGLLKNPVTITPVGSDQYPTPAQRPCYSILDKGSMWEATGITPVHWRIQLRAMLKEMTK
ncbi:MAG: dTDP-4-dehydrorhamnose reductase [Desulfobacter sp.]|nr:MAG: dTDP-4-dehydrorhamnose reductase [Desulfobacter sp.]